MTWTVHFYGTKKSQVTDPEPAGSPHIHAGLAEKTGLTLGTIFAKKNAPRKSSAEKGMKKRLRQVPSHQNLLTYSNIRRMGFTWIHNDQFQVVSVASFAWFGMLWESQGAQKPSFPKLREFQNGRIPPSHPGMSWYVHLVSIYFLYMFYINVPWLPSFPIPHPSHRFPRLASPTLVPALPLLHKFLWPFAGPFCGRSDPDLSRSVDPRLGGRVGGRGLCREPTGQLIQIEYIIYIDIIYMIIYNYIYIQNMGR